MERGSTAPLPRRINQGGLLDPSGRPYVDRPERRLAKARTERRFHGIQGYSITRDEYERLRKEQFGGVLRVVTRGPDTTGFQEWFLDAHLAWDDANESMVYPMSEGKPPLRLPPI